MVTIGCETDPESCRKLWQQLIPAEKLVDLWDVRECFHRRFRRDLAFITAEEDGRIIGFLPLARVPEKDGWGYFPGETWKGTTWLEQNRIIARDSEVFRRMFDWLNERRYRYHLRYLVDHSHLDAPDVVDETGYLFIPPQYDYNIEKYHEQFSRKSIKALLKGEEDFRGRGLEFRLDHWDDFEVMVEFNVGRFGDSSYFSDDRFSAAFRDLRDELIRQNRLKMTTALVEGRPAAVDFGVVYNNVYTLLAGGTSADFPGIAKVINMFHLRTACGEKYAEADFLCGDFAWKPMFHLTPRPLYLLSNVAPVCHPEA